MLVNMEDSYKTISGIKVVILTINAPGDYPVIGYYTWSKKVVPGMWDKTGVYYSKTCCTYDLVQINNKENSYLICAHIRLLDDTKEHVKLMFEFQIKTEATRQDDIKREAEEYGTSLFITLHPNVNFTLRIASAIKL